MIMSCLEKHRSRIGVPLSEERSELPSDQKTQQLTGALYKRSESGAWKKRYFILSQDVLTYYPDILSSVNETAPPKTIPLVFAGVFTVPLMDRPFCLRLFTKERVYVLSAESAHERLQWVNMIRTAISKRLTEIDIKLKAANSINLTLSHGGIASSLIGGSLMASADSIDRQDSNSPAPVIVASPSPAPAASATPPASTSPASSAPASEKKRKKEKSGTIKKKSVSAGSGESAAVQAPAASPAPSTPEEETPPPKEEEPAATDDKKTNGKGTVKDKKRKKKLKRDQTLSKITKTGDIYKFSSGSSKVAKQKMVLKQGELQLFKAGKTKPQTAIDLLLVQPPSTNVETTTHKDATIYQFTLVTSDRKYVFGTDTEEDAQAWIEHVQMAHEALNAFSGRS